MTDSSGRALSGWRDLPWVARAPLLLVAVGLIALCVRLWPDWLHNPDLSHGFFMPLVFALLVYEARQGTPRFLRRTWRTQLGVVVLLGLALGALVAAGLFAASLDWTHPLVNGSLTAAAVCFLGAALLIYSRDSVRLVGCNWNAVVAIGLWLLCTAIPPGTYTRLTLALQFWISKGVVETLHLLGIAAIRHGNIIELANVTVGVEEACSGVRSLISCIFAGFFFSATLVRSPRRRALIILLSAPLALLMNFVRSLTLTLLANSGVEIAGTWHDVTGFAVLGVTAVILGALAYLLGRHQTAPAAPAAAAPSAPQVPRAPMLTLLTALGLAAALVVFSLANTHPAIRTGRPAPDLDALLPANVPGWDVSTSDNLYQFRDTLETDHLAQRIYRKLGADGKTIQVIIYLAYWHPGQTSVSLVASHTPDACWPGSGWVAKPMPVQQAALTVDHRTLPAAEYRLFTYGDFPQYVWFWHIYDGHPITFLDPYSPVALLRIAWRYGFRHAGDQLFVRVSSNRPWPEVKNEPFLADFFHRVHPYGL